jgi:GNAT superfamily N-acetyltransferase
MIRPYIASDWLEVCRVYDASKPLELRSGGVEGSFIRLCDDQPRIDAFAMSTVLVWEEDRSLMGFVGYRAEFIGWLFVHPNAFRKGIGRALLSSAIREVSGEPYLWTMRENESAISLYASAGFQIEEHRQTQNRGMQCNAVKMKRRKAA